MVMEKKDFASAQPFRLNDSTLWIGIFATCYLAVLPMADTIALRNVALLALLVCLAWRLPKLSSEIRIAWPFLLWAAYLLIFPFISTDLSVALRSLEGQWGRGLLAMLAGGGVALVFRSKSEDMPFYLGTISATSIIVYLVLAAWKTWQDGVIPWGYWGRESHHADLGYAAGQTVVVLTAVLVTTNRRRWVSIALIIAAFLCTAVAFSRAGLAFAVLGGALVFVVAYFTHRSRGRLYVLGGVVLLLLAGGSMVAITAKVDARWGQMASKLYAGFLGNAVEIECEGTASIEGEVISRYGEGEAARRIVDSIRDGDGARVVLLRAGIDLSLKHPWGLDGSRQSFQKLLRMECPSPKLNMAHAHNGWIDTALAIGWIGVLLYLAVFSYYIKCGYQVLRSEQESNVWALILVALSVFWMLRAMTDSVFRDHMFEMQGFVLTYALVALRDRGLAQDASSG
jgi:O-antigen ligase